MFWLFGQFNSFESLEGVFCVFRLFFFTFNKGGIFGFGCMDSFEGFDSFKELGFGCIDNLDNFKEGILGVWTVLIILRGGVFGVDSFNNFERGA